jgi:hypothetical protein
MKKHMHSYNFKTYFTCSSSRDFSVFVTEKNKNRFVLKDTYVMVSLFIILFVLMLCINYSAVILVNLSMVLIILIACIKPKGMLLC